MKTCTKCRVPQEEDKFSKNKTTKDGLMHHCKTCISGYYKLNMESIKEKSKLHRVGNPEMYAKAKREFRKNNKELVYQRGKSYRERNVESEIARSKKWSDDNKEHLLKYKNDYYINNRSSINAMSAKYYLNNKPTIALYMKEYNNRMYKEDVLFRLAATLRSRINAAFNSGGWKKACHTKEILGENWETVKLHIESLFIDGMTWGNKGEWQIDHKKPLASAKSEQELIKLCHYTNLQPLWAVDNKRKGSNEVVNGVIINHKYKRKQYGT